MSLLPSELFWDKCPCLARGRHQEGEGSLCPVPSARGRGFERKMLGYPASVQGMWLSPLWAYVLHVLSLWHRLIFDNNHTLHL